VRYANSIARTSLKINCTAAEPNISDGLTQPGDKERATCPDPVSRPWRFPLLGG